MKVADVLATRLRELGVKRVWGDPLGDLDHFAVGDPDLAVILADSDGRIGEVDGGSRLGAALIAGPILHLSSRPGGAAPMQVAGSPEELLDLLVEPAGLAIPDTNAIHLDLDLNAEVDDSLVATVSAERQPVITFDPSMADLRLVAIVGPGVVRSGAVEALDRFARSAGVGVFNTWGAKGVQRWDSLWHFGTVGPQIHDLDACELDNFDVVVTSGLDEHELPAGIPHPAVQDVPPSQLAVLTHHWEGAAEDPVRPGFYDAAAAVVSPLYEAEPPVSGGRLSAARAALHLSGALPDGAMAVADPGPAGFWVARTFPTSIPNSVCVPSTGGAGFAAAAALVCSLEGRPCLAITSPGLQDEAVTADLLSLADSFGHSVSMQVWDPDAPRPGDAQEHVDLCIAQVNGAKGTARVAVDLEVPDSLRAVGGEVHPALAQG
jgi:hypothetical protein